MAAVNPSWQIYVSVVLILIILQESHAQARSKNRTMLNQPNSKSYVNTINEDSRPAEPVIQELIKQDIVDVQDYVVFTNRTNIFQHNLKPDLGHVPDAVPPHNLGNHDGFQASLPDKFVNKGVQNEWRADIFNPIVRENIPQNQNVLKLGFLESMKVTETAQPALLKIKADSEMANLKADFKGHETVKKDDFLNDVSNLNVDRNNILVQDKRTRLEGVLDVGVKKFDDIPERTDFNREDRLMERAKQTLTENNTDVLKFMDADKKELNDIFDDDDEEEEDEDDDIGEQDNVEQVSAKNQSHFDSADIKVASFDKNEILPMNSDGRREPVGYKKLVNESPVKNDNDVNNNSMPKVDENPGSLKVVWDWTDFVVNFEPYVMPEQKVRRAPHASTGKPWPLPQYFVTNRKKVFKIEQSSFRFQLPKIKCDIIEKAVERYRQYILEDSVEDMYDNFQHAQSTMFEEPLAKYDTPLYLEAPLLVTVQIKIRRPCAKYPTADMDESYDMFVKQLGAEIRSNEVWGALRGLETFSQIVFKGSDQMLYVHDTVISDFPRFSHRGILIDSSRHFIFKETIYNVLEAMAQNKMNVLHWHLVDDQSFPYYSSAYPDLSAKGAFHPSFVYMPKDVADIIEFARIRGIRVFPEFDTPGHTYSWGLSRPDLLTQCYLAERPVNGYLGPIDPSKNETFRFLKNFFKDVLHTFKDQYLHLGGDEVPMTCWQSNPEIMKLYIQLGLAVDTKHMTPADLYYNGYDVRKILEYYVSRLIKDVKSIALKRPNGLKLVFWQEIMNNNIQLSNDTIIHVWLGGMEEVERAISLGMNVIFSSCWYINLVETGTKWTKYYQCDPADNTMGYVIDESKVLGGEACLWAEYIDNEDLMTTLWPKASATAERLWSNKEVKDIDNAAPRLQEHRCRMLSRGLTVGQISGPDYCLRRGKKYHQVLNETFISNSTSTPCDKGHIEVEKIKVEFEQKGVHIVNCSQPVLHGVNQIVPVILILVIMGIIVTLIIFRKKLKQVRLYKNKTILIAFVTLIFIYFAYYISIWMQTVEFKGSIEKQRSSNAQS